MASDPLLQGRRAEADLENLEQGGVSDVYTFEDVLAAHPKRALKWYGYYPWRRCLTGTLCYKSSFVEQTEADVGRHSTGWSCTGQRRLGNLKRPCVTPPERQFV